MSSISSMSVSNVDTRTLGRVGFEMALAIAYFSIPVVLSQMRSLETTKCTPIKRIFYLINALIVMCGITRLLTGFAPWFPSVESISCPLNLVTLVVAAWTSIEIYHVAPFLRSMPSPCELKRMNSELETHKDDLSKLVAQRTVELNQEKARWQLVIDQLPQILWLKSLEGKIEFYNKKWYQYTGLPPGEINCTQAVHPDDYQVVRARWLDGCQWRDSSDYKLRIKSADNEYRWHLVRSMPIRDVQTHQVIQWCGIATDIHDTEVMKELSVADATRKTRFLAMMSHEMRTPLTGIMGMSTLLGDTELETSQTDMLNNIKSSADKLLALVNNILDLFKLHNDKLHLDLTTFALKDFVNESLATILENATSSRIEVHDSINYQHFPSIISADKARLKQVLGHILSNAVKFTPNGGNVHISARLDGSDGRRLIKFSVRDTGIGIQDEDKAAIFEIFSQLDSSSTRRFGGTGVGLAIAKGLVKLMQGTVSCESTPGKGSTFHFTFEFSDATKDSAGTVEETMAPLASKPLLYTSTSDDMVSSTGSIISDISSDQQDMYDSDCDVVYADDECGLTTRILVVDDTEMNQKVLKRLLSSLGYDDVDIAVNGLEAVQAMSMKAYDIVFMDMEMPVMDGVTATRQIRLLPTNTLVRQPHIIAVTANAFQEDIQKCVDAGMCVHMAKPVKRDQLKKRMDGSRRIRGGTEKCGCQKYHVHHHNHPRHLHHHAAVHNADLHQEIDIPLMCAE